jgi:hypothetical protein
MERESEHLREQADRARWWARCVSDPIDRERMEAVARDYERMARNAEPKAVDRRE